MFKLLAVGLGLALSVASVHAQPTTRKPAPVPAQPAQPAQPAKPATPSPIPAPTKTPTTSEKADETATLQHGGADRPWAAGVAPDKQSLALHTFQEGNVMLNDGIFTKAVEKYREALRSWEHPAIHYNLALALMNLDQPVEVHDSLQKAIAYGPAPLEKDRYERAKEYILLVEKQIATIEISCHKEGAKVTVDGEVKFTVVKGAANVYKARVRIGKHTFVAEKPGYATGLDAPFIGPNETFRVELKLYTAEELTRYRRRWGGAQWAPYAVLGAGVVVGVAGGLMTLSANSSYDDFDAEVARCNESSSNGGCDVNAGGLRDMRDSGDTKRMLGYIGYGVAGGALITGAVLVYLNRTQAYQISSDEYRREQLEKDRTARKVAVAPFVAPGMAGALIQGSF